VLPALGAGIYLNAGSTGPLPAETAAAMAELTDWQLRTGRAHTAYLEEVLARLEEARASVAAVIGAMVEDVAVTTSTSQALASATWAADWRPGDRAITTTVEHDGALGPLYALRERHGIDLVHVEAGDGDDERLLADLEAVLTPTTRLVSVSHVTWATGAVLPIRRIAELAHARGAWLLVDGAQAAGAIPVDVTSLGADFYAFAGQKWLLGPEGVGGLWVDPSVAERALLSAPGFLSFERLDSRGTAVPWRTARRFDAAGLYWPAVAGLARSAGWLAMYVGLAWAHERATGMAAALARRLAAIEGVTVETPSHRMATLVTFRVAGWPADAARDELGARIFAITLSVPPLDAIRASVGWFNTADEIERFAGAVELLASHSPEAIPPRRTLRILEAGP
jgi:L-cysteine/cystine lyase